MAQIWVSLIFATVFVNLHAGLSFHCPDGCECSSNTLVCVDNNMTTIPTNTSLQEIIVFNMSSNQIQTLEEKVFFENNLVKVEIMDLSKNSISDIHQNAFYGLNNLKELYFQDNKLKKIHPETFSPLTQLTVLDLSDNSFRKLEDKTFESVTLLKDLRVSGLWKFNEKLFNPLKNLKYLRIQFVTKGNGLCKKQISKVLDWGEKNNVTLEHSCVDIEDDDSEPFGIFSYNIPLHPSLENTITHGEFIIGIVITVGVLLLLIISLVILAVIVRQTEKIPEEFEDNSYMSDFEPYRGQLSPTNTKEYYWPSSCDDISIIKEGASVAPTDNLVSNDILETVKVQRDSLKNSS